MIDAQPVILRRFHARTRRANGIGLNRPRTVAAAVIVAFGCLVALGQFQGAGRVGQPVYGGGGGARGGSVRYGYVGPTAPRSSNLLPSELRNANYRSGALPSEIRMNARAGGPLAPGGAASYIPTNGSVVIRAGTTPPINAANVMAPRAAGSSGISAAAAPSIRYGTSAAQTPWSGPVSTASPAQMLAASRPPPTMSGNPFGTIRYPAAAP